MFLIMTGIALWLHRKGFAVVFWMITVALLVWGIAKDGLTDDDDDF